MFRGSVRLKKMANSGVAATNQPNGCLTIVPTLGNQNPSQNQPGQAYFFANNFFYPLVPFNQAYYGNFEVQVPYYNRTPSSISFMGGPGQTINANNTTYPSTFFEASFVTPGTISAFSLCRQIGEDFDFGFFTGTVPLTTTTVGTSLATTYAQVY